MVDGKMSHGGLTDRFRNILSVYSYCKSHQIPFKLYYSYPCNLSYILQPNKYDWIIRPSDLSSHYMSTKELVLYVTPYELPIDEFKERNNKDHLAILDNELSKHKHVQYHVYGNAFFAEGYYRDLFKELFRPSLYLKERIEQSLSALPKVYEAVTLRFQQLLGDFTEGDFEVLPEDQKKALIKECIDRIRFLYKAGCFATTELLVTSDSPTFIKEVSKLPFVYTVQGEMEHMDFTKNPDIEMNTKSFVDLFLLMNASRISLLKIGKMYKSGFPSFAAELGGKKYREFIINN